MKNSKNHDGRPGGILWWEFDFPIHPNGGKVYFVKQEFNLTDPGRRLNRPGVYCVKHFGGVYISADCKVNGAHDWCGCKRGTSEKFCFWRHPDFLAYGALPLSP